MKLLISLTAFAAVASATGASQAAEIPLPADLQFPEGVGVDAEGTLFVGSITTGAIARFEQGAPRSEIFIPPGQLVHGAAVGVQVDQRKNLLWVCDASPFTPVASDLVGFDLDSGAERVRHALPVVGDTVICNDITIDRKGDVFVTESFSGRVYRLRRRRAFRTNSFELWSDDPLLVTDGTTGFGANGIAFARGMIFVVNFDTGTLVGIRRGRNGSARQGFAVPLYDLSGEPTRLVAPDGLLSVGARTLVVVQNDSSGAESGLKRVTLFREKGRLIGQLETIATLDTPATAVRFKDIIWATESQFDHLFGFDPNPPTTPFRLVGVPFRR